MFSVIFEVHPKSDHSNEYLDNAKLLIIPADERRGFQRIVDSHSSATRTSAVTGGEKTDTE